MLRWTLILFLVVPWPRASGRGRLSGRPGASGTVDFIRAKSTEENFIHVIDGMEASLDRKARRVSLHHVIARGQAPTIFHRLLPQVRSFVAFLEVCMPSLEGFRYVRVLHLQLGRRVREQGNANLTGICELFLLRYIKIEGWDINLPNQFWRLHYLETVDLDRVIGKITIPSDIAALHRLSHLIVPAGTEFQDWIGSLKSLHTLKPFDLSASSLESIDSLCKLTNLRDLELCYCERRYDEKVSYEALNALQFSLATLASSSNCLKSLVLRGYGSSSVVHSDWCNSLSTCPQDIRKLHLGSLLSRIPKWIAQLHSLYSLHLMVDKVVATDGNIDILAGLPSLVYLWLAISPRQRERIVIPSMAFPGLKHMHLKCPEPLLEFRAGALPRLQTLRLEFTGVGWRGIRKWLEPDGIHHLPSGLKKIAVICLKESVPDRSTMAALRSVFTRHHPGVDLC